jgi:hypothetical protein
MGIVESEAALSAQLKGVGEMVAGIGGSEMGTDNSRNSKTVGEKGSVCVDIDADEDGGMEGGFV